MQVPDFVRNDLHRLELTQDEPKLEKLAAYLAALLDANQRMNLTAIRDADMAWSRMIVDSLTALPGLDQLAPGSTVIDVGTGGGLPGIPLAIALPTIEFTLLEATAKKCAFLDRVVSSLGLDNVRVHNARAEDAGHDAAHRQRYDLAVCRAVGPMPVLLELCLPLVKINGRLLAMKGPRVEQELDASGDAMAKLGAGEVAVIDAYPEEFENNLVIVSVFKPAATDQTYPRPPGIPKKQPL